MGGGYKRGRKNYSVIVWVVKYCGYKIDEFGILFLVGACQKEYVPLHSVHIKPRQNLNFRIGLLDSQEVILTVVLARIHLDLVAMLLI